MKKLSRISNVAVFLTLCALLVSVLACAAMKANQARGAYIDDAVSDYVYDKPCKNVWPDARQLLFEHDYSVKDTGEAATMTVETDWKYSDSGSSKYLVQGTEPSEEECQVKFTKKSKSDTSSSASTSDDWDMAWQLLQRVEPDVAAEIEQEADAEAEEVKAEAKAK